VQVKGQVIPRLLAAVADKKTSKILTSVMTKEIDAKDDTVLSKTKDGKLPIHR
jgi:transposase-like protein